MWLVVTIFDNAELEVVQIDLLFIALVRDQIQVFKTKTEKLVV